MAKRPKKIPMNKGNGEVGYCKPPFEHRFKKGQAPNPLGRPSAGLVMKEWINLLCKQGHTEKAIRKIAKDVKAPWPKRAAANRILRTMEAGDLSDFAGLLRGENTIEDLRAMGVNTEVVKRFKQKTRIVPKGEGKVEEVIEREIELHDRAGIDFDRVLDRTLGKPSQPVEHAGKEGGAIEHALTVEHTINHKIDYDALANDLEQFTRGRIEESVAGDG